MCVEELWNTVKLYRGMTVQKIMMHVPYLYTLNNDNNNELQ